MADPSAVPMLLATAVPAAVAGVATWGLPRVWRIAGRRQVLAVWAVVAVAASVALVAHGGFAVAGSATPLVLPGGLAATLVVLALAPGWTWWQDRDAGPVADLVTVAVLVLALHLLSFPWWNRGAEGWLWLAGGTIAALALALGARFAADRHHLGTALLWAVLAGAAAPLLVMLTAVGHAQALAVVLAPVGAAAAVGLVAGVRIFQPGGAVLPAVVVGALLANAGIRYVGYGDPAGVNWTLRLSPLALVAAPWVHLALRRVAPGRFGTAVGALGAALVLAAGIAAAAWAYGYEDPAAAGEDDAADFYQNYGG